MRHLFNGDAAAEAAGRGYVAGEIIVWREALTHGPVRGTPGEEWIATRAAFLQGTFSPADPSVVEALRRQEEHLRANPTDSLAIWTERDLSCQLTLAYICAALRRDDAHPYRVSLVSAEGGRELGSLQTDQFRALWEGRRLLSDDEIRSAAAAWDAYVSDQPSQIADLLPRLPFNDLKQTLAAHLRRFPAVSDGLGSVERLIVRLAAEKPCSFQELFTPFRSELSILGFGDAQFLYDLRRLAQGRRKLIEVRGDDGSFDPESIRKIVVVATADGEAVLAGKHDALDLLEGEYWLGGVHVVGGALLHWRWDDQLQRIVRR